MVWMEYFCIHWLANNQRFGIFGMTMICIYLLCETLWYEICLRGSTLALAGVIPELQQQASQSVTVADGSI